MFCRRCQFACSFARSSPATELFVRPFTTGAITSAKASSTTDGHASKKLQKKDSPSGHDAALTTTDKSEFNVDNPQSTLVSYDSIKLKQTEKGTIDVRTHTGQFWEPQDYRNVRFTDGFAGKLVNRRFAIDLVNSVPPISRTERVVYCDGGDNPALGHPKVYINLDKPGAQVCGYCGLRFIKEGGDMHEH